MDVCIIPGKPGGTLKAPDSKSDIHRKLIASALCREETLIRTADTEFCDDVLATADCLRALGAGIRIIAGKGIQVSPVRDIAGIPELDCRECGSTLRFLIPVAAALYDKARLTGAPSLAARPLAPLLEALEKHGKRFGSSSLPLETEGKLSSGEYLLPGNVSSQFVSGLLFALPLLEGDSSIRLSSPLESAEYADMTLRVLSLFGIRIDKDGDRGFNIAGGQRYVSPGELTAEGDWSSCAFLMPAGVIYTGLDENSLQPDRAVKKYIELLKPGTEAGDIRIDVSPFPDLVPILAVMACSVKGRVFLENAGRLRFKESDRLKSVCSMICSLGGKASEQGDSLVVEGCGVLAGGETDGFKDHRIVMAAVAASALCLNRVIIRGAEAVNKSYPGFFRDFAYVGGKYSVI